jgi:hypothetical protein
MYSKLFQSVEENLHNLGYSGKAKAKWFGDVAASVRDNEVPVAACQMNFTDATNSAGDKLFSVIFRNDKVAGISWPKAMTTQLHAYDQFAQAGGYVELYMEMPVVGNMKFLQDVVHIFRGQFGVRVHLFLSAIADVPVVEGVNGAVADAAFTDAGVLLPYGRIAAAGELA